MHREEASPATATVVYEQIFARSKVADECRGDVFPMS